MQIIEYGKLSISSTSAPVEDTCLARHLFIYDRYNNLNFLIDTGSVISAIPPSTPRPPASSYVLFAANGSKIATYGRRTLTLHLMFRRPITWTFFIADVTVPIIGADLLGYYQLLPDIKNEVLIDSGN